MVTCSPTITAVGVIVKSPRMKRAGDRGTHGVVVGVGVGLGSEVNEGDSVDVDVGPMVVAVCNVFVVGSLMVSVTVGGTVFSVALHDIKKAIEPIAELLAMSPASARNSLLDMFLALFFLSAIVYLHLQRADLAFIPKLYGRC